MFSSKDMFIKGSAGVLPSRSVRMIRGAYAELAQGSGNRQIWTFATWVKPGSDHEAINTYVFGAGTGATSYTALNVGLAAIDIQCVQAGVVRWRYTSLQQMSADPTGWRHLCLSVDTTQATAANRIRFYINGILVPAAAWSTATAPALNFFDPFVNNSQFMRIGDARGPASNSLDGMLAETYLISGLALDTTSFCAYNSTTGELEPKKYTGLYGTTGFYLNYSDNSSSLALFTDYSGNGITFSSIVGADVTPGFNNDSLFDYPKNVDGGSYQNGNYMTLCMRDSRNTWATLPANGGGYAIVPTGTGTIYYDSFFDLNTGKYYWECQVLASTTTCILTLFNGTTYSTGVAQSASTTYGYRFDNTTGVYEYTTNGSTWTTITTLSTGASNFYTLAIQYTNTAVATGYINTGARAFTYNIPTGYTRACTVNAANPTLTPAQHFQTQRYVGNGATQIINNSYNGVSSLSFQPDIVLIAPGNSFNVNFWDITLGVTNFIATSAAGTITTDATSVNSFNSNGFTTGAYIQTNQNTIENFGYQWKCSNGTVTNTQGTITSTVSANTTSGVSVVRYIGTSVIGTVGHGLGVPPECILIKNIDTPFNWGVYWAPSGNTQVMALNSNAAQSPSINYWRNTTPTNQVFTLGVVGPVNTSPNRYQAYCFASVPGFSKIGSYLGSGSALGQFIPLGFKPSWILIKVRDSTANWIFIDESLSFDINNQYRSLFANDPLAISNLTQTITFCTTGFMLKGTNPIINSGSLNYNYIAMAASPFKTALGR